MAENLELTKRNVLKIGSTFFDPPGIIALIVIQCKVIFQQICKEKINWDDLIPELIISTWNKFIACLKAIKIVKVQRCVCVK